MNLFAYRTHFVFDVDAGKVKALYANLYNNETKEWRKADNFYYPRTKLAD